MVLLAAGVCTKSGKALVSRQFVEMTRARIEGLLAAFPKLISSDKNAQRQHTFVETESVRYVYQPMDQLYMLLITTKNSNILEDLETLRLFSRVIPEYCRNLEEKDIREHAFELIFAFDEIVALGYRESVNLAQIRTFTEMDSHEERVFYQIKKTQEEEARKVARDKAKQLARERADLAKKGGMGRPGAMAGSGIGSGDVPKYDSIAPQTAAAFIDKPKPKEPSRPSGPNRALKLGQKKVDEDQFINQLKSEGQDIAPSRLAKPAGGGLSAAVPTASAPAVKMDAVHARCEEKLNVVVTRDGGVEQFEVTGLLQLRVNDKQFVNCQIHMDNNDARNAQIQTHPNLDKKVWQQSSCLSLKNPAKPFPLENDIGVLKWRYQSQDETQLPLTINCWPSESANGCEVNIEYTLEDETLSLNDVLVLIPLPPSTTPVISECDTEYKFEKAKAQLLWMIPVIDGDNKTGTLDFTTVGGNADHFFPVRVSFSSRDQFCNIKPNKVVMGDQTVPFSTESTLFTEKYEVV